MSLPISLRIAVLEGEPIQSGPGNEGCGECVKYNGQFYYYNVGHCIPRNRPAVVKWEGNYCGRVHGDKEFLIVAFNGNNFTVLESHYSGVRDALKKYKGMNNQQAIAVVEAQEAAREAEFAARPKCGCGGLLLQFEDDQRADESYTCYLNRTKKKS